MWLDWLQAAKLSPCSYLLAARPTGEVDGEELDASLSVFNARRHEITRYVAMFKARQGDL